MCSEADILWLENASIKSVNRTELYIELLIYKDNVEKVLKLDGLSGETAVYYGPGNLPSANPDPEQPIDLIEVVETNEKSLTIFGYRFNEPWHEWKIMADSLTLTTGAKESGT